MKKKKIFSSSPSLPSVPDGPVRVVPSPLSMQSKVKLGSAYVQLLIWWCETMEHEADPICNLLFSSRHLIATSAPTQIKGLNA